MLTTALRYIITNKYLIIILIIVLSYTTFFAYYTFVKYKIESLTTKVTTLEDENLKKNLYIQNLKIDYDKILKSRDELNELAQKSAKNIETLRKKLNREIAGKKSIEELAFAKPTLVEGYINKRIKAQLNCFKYIDLNGECK